MRIQEGARVIGVARAEREVTEEEAAVVAEADDSEELVPTEEADSMDMDLPEGESEPTDADPGI